MAIGRQARGAIEAALKKSSIAFAAAALVACGGGGGGGGADPAAGGSAQAPASAGTPVAATPPASSGGSTTGTSNGGTASSGGGTGTASAAGPAAGTAAFQRTDFQVNTATAGSQAGGVVAHLANGGYVVAWDSRSDAANPGLSEVRMQRFDAHGQPVGAEQLVSGRGNYAQVAAFADGRFLVTWRLSPFAYEVDAQGALFGADGVQVGGTLALGNGFNSYQPRPMALPDGTFVVAIDTDGGKYGPSYGLLQRFAADGTALGAPARFESQLSTQTGAYSPNSAGQARTALVADGRIAAAWVAAGTGISELRLSLFDGQVQALAAPVVLDARSTPIALASIVALADGGYAVSWTAGASGEAQAAFLEIFNADGSSRGRRQLAASNGGNYGQIATRLGALADGSVAAGWAATSWDGTQYRRVLATQRFGGDGAPIGTAQQVDTQLWPASDGFASDSLDLTATGGSGFLLLYGRWTEQASWDVRATAR